MNKKSIIIEIGVEEIPSSYMGGILNQFREMVERALNEERVEFSKIEVTGTARRLVVEIKDVSEFQKPILEEIKGPPANHAFGNDGKPTEVLRGFLKKSGIGIEDIKVVDTERGKYVFGIRRIKGERIEKVIPRIIVNVLNSLSFPKSMRWGADGKFVRPVRWILSLYGKKVLPFEFMGVKAGKYTFASRAHGSVKVKVGSSDDYWKVMKRWGVIPHHIERRREVERYLRNLERKGWRFRIREEFIDSVIFSVEKPHGFTGSFDAKFLKLPSEFIRSILEGQVKCLSIEEDGNLLPHFVGFSNVRPTKKVIEGYVRVVTARLEDAVFYAEEDLKKSIDEHLENLKRIVHHEKLGSLYHKTMRLRVLAKFLRPHIMPDADEDFVDRLALFSKFDYATSTCQEFPELRGIVGMWLGEKYGIESEICRAIREQYLPSKVGDELPSSRAGILLGVANRIEEITSLFYIGYRPTGSEDPFGVRRDALALVEIISQRVSIPLKEAIKRGVELFDTPPPNLAEDIFQFIKERFRYYMQSKDIPVELIDGVVEKVEDLREARIRIENFDAFSKKNPEEAEKIISARKRISNIIVQAGNPELSSVPDPSLLKEKEEKDLYEYCFKNADYVIKLCDSGDYNALFNEYVRISDILQKFFDRVFVMVENEKLKLNRLTLLKMTGDLYDYFADFRKIPTKKFAGG